MYTMINENQKGFLFKKGKLQKLLSAGSYHTSRTAKIELQSIEDELFSESCTLDTLLQLEDIKAATTVIDVKDEQLALHYVNGLFAGCLGPAKHAFWNTTQTHTFTIIDCKEPFVEETLPKYLFSMIPARFFQCLEVEEYEKALVYYDNQLTKVLDGGIYYFWNTKTKIKVDRIDMRMKQFEMNGQEILTKDKVTLRINMICRYRILDGIKIATEIDQYEQQLYTMIQLALREHIGKHTVDELLANKDAITDDVFSQLQKKGTEIYVDILEASIKDIILPGEMRDIMNTVLIAEKRAQANVIKRREEVASTRSLLNTAKLMEENKTLYRLKELEFLESICEHVDSITLNGSTDILSQLSLMTQRKEEC